MRFVILASPESWYARDLERAAAGQHEIVTLPFSEIAASIGARKGNQRPPLTVSAAGIDLGAFDAVLVRTMPPGSLEQVVFRMDCLARLEAAGCLVINPAKAIEAAVDKFLTSARLAAAGLPTPQTIACQTVDEALTAFASLGGDVVLKPLFGSEGRGITRLNDEALAQRAFKMLTQLGAVLYLQQFIAHEGYDLRLFVVGQQILAMRRRNPDDWRTNISRGAIAEGFRPDAALIAMARLAAETVGAPLAGVDILPGKDGQRYVIEVNAVPGWKALNLATGSDIAQLVLEFAVAEASRR